MKTIFFVVFILNFSLALSFDKNIRNQANDVPPFEKVALISITQNASDAIEFYRQNYQPNNQNAVEILNTASQILSGIGKIKEAEQLLQYGLKEHPANLTLLNSLGNTSAKLSKYDQAIDVYSKILELDSFATFQNIKGVKNRLALLRNRHTYQNYTGAYRLNNDNLLIFKFDPFLHNYPVFLDINSGQYEVLYPVSENQFYFTDQSDDTLGTITFANDGKFLELVNGTQKNSGYIISIHNENVDFESNGAKLKGEILYPDSKGPHPGIVLVHGSGVSTRYHLYLEAYFFAANGLSVLIYDKRGSGLSEGTIPLETNYEILSQDALSAINVLKTFSNVDKNKTGFWGFSEGGWIVPLTISKTEGVHFAILSSGAAVNTFEQTKQSMINNMHLNRLPDSLIADANNYMDDLYELLVAETKFTVVEEIILDARQTSWSGYVLLPRSEWEYGLWMELVKHDPAPDLKKLNANTLVVYGKMDQSVIIEKNEPLMREYLQCSGTDFEINVINNANHQFMISDNQYAPEYFYYMKNFLSAKVTDIKD